MWQNTSKNQVQQYMQQNPYRLLALSFLATMTIGTILLMLPISHAQGHSTTLVDAAFTAVSCVSVTGLSGNQYDFLVAPHHIKYIGACLAKSSW